MLWGSRRPRRLLTATLAILVSLPLANPYLASGEGGPKPPPTDPPIRADYHEQTGKLTFLGASPQSPVVIQGALAAGLAPEGRARAAVEVYGRAFGLRDPSAELELLGLDSTQRGRTSARYHQAFHGVPVLGGEIVVNQDSMGRLFSMSGEISPDLSLSIDPEVTAQDASDLAIAATARIHQLDPAELVVSNPELWIYDERLLRPSDRPASAIQSENRIRPVFVGRGFGNYADRKTRDDVRYILTYIAPSLGYESQARNPVIREVLDAYPDWRIIMTFDVRETATGRDRAALIDKFGKPSAKD